MPKNDFRNNMLSYNNKLNQFYRNNDIISKINPDIKSNNIKNDINNKMNENFMNNLLYNTMNYSNNIYSRNNPQFIPINRNFKNNIYNHLYNVNNNPQLFHPHFHSNIIKFSSNLQIQCPVQMLVKKSKINKLARHKLITYYPPKVQIEIRPCYIYQSQNPFPLSPNYFNNFNNINQFQNQIIPHNYIYNNDYLNQRIVHNKVKRRRPVFKIPACKKASVSQGKSLNFIHKYYDENFILEEDDEEENNKRYKKRKKKRKK